MLWGNNNLHCLFGKENYEVTKQNSEERRGVSGNEKGEMRKTRREYKNFFFEDHQF